MVVVVAVGAEAMEAVWVVEMVRIGVETILSTLGQMTMETRMVITKAGRTAVEGTAGMAAAAVAVVVMEDEEEIPMLKTHINPDHIRVSPRPTHTAEEVEEAGTAGMVDTVMALAGVVEEAEEVMADMVDMVATRDHREGRLKIRLVVEVEMAMVHLRHLR